MTTSKTYSATALAAEIGVDAKSLRGWLRKNFTRIAEVKNTTWIITEEAAEAARVHYAKQRTDAPQA
jgi:maltodextrin utilization protein YvdJ